MSVLTATQTGKWKNKYEISADGKPVATLEGQTLGVGGSFELDQRPYTVSANALATRYELVDQTGATAAVADRVGRKDWTVGAGGRTYAFRRGSVWRLEQLLLDDDGQPAGAIRRSALDSDEATADLPGLPAPVQVFVLAVVLSNWDLVSAATG